MDDPKFPGITYRRGSSGWITPVLHGTGIRVQTIVADLKLGMSTEQISAEYELDGDRIRESLACYEAHRSEIDASIRIEEDLERKHA